MSVLRIGIPKCGTYKEVRPHMEWFEPYPGMSIDNEGTLCLMTCYNHKSICKYQDEVFYHTVNIGTGITSYEETRVAKVIYYESVRRECRNYNKRLYADSKSKRPILYAIYNTLNHHGKCTFTPYGLFVVTEDVEYNNTKKKRGPSRYILTPCHENYVF